MLDVSGLEINNISNSFTKYNPIINFYYFTFVIMCTIFFRHPSFILITLAISFIYLVFLKGVKGIKFGFFILIPLFFLVAIIHCGFNHAGITILFYLDNGNPMTFESIILGLVLGSITVAIIMWISCYHEIITSDKIIYLLGRLFPKISLFISILLRIVPRYKEQIKKISIGQKSIGRGLNQGNIIRRIKNGIRILSIMATWVIENTIETSNSMRARGYGIKGRTSFGLFKFNIRDKITLIIMVFLSIIVILGVYLGINRIVYLPKIKIARTTELTYVVNMSYLLFCSIPIVSDIIEEVRWRRHFKI